MEATWHDNKNNDYDYFKNDVEPAKSSSDDNFLYPIIFLSLLSFSAQNLNNSFYTLSSLGIIITAIWQ